MGGGLKPSVKSVREEEEGEVGKGNPRKLSKSGQVIAAMRKEARDTQTHTRSQESCLSTVTGRLMPFGQRCPRPHLWDL